MEKIKRVNFSVIRKLDSYGQVYESDSEGDISGDFYPANEVDVMMEKIDGKINRLKLYIEKVFGK